MKGRKRIGVFLLLLVAASLVLAACGGGSEDEEDMAPCADEANVEGVTVEQRSDGYYAIVGGHYPDSCTRVSDVDQKVEGDTISITVCTASPPGAMCAQMITPFELEILLETGGQEAGEYRVDVNGVTTTFVLE